MERTEGSDVTWLRFIWWRARAAFWLWRFGLTLVFSWSYAASLRPYFDDEYTPRWAVDEDGSYWD